MLRRRGEECSCGISVLKKKDHPTYFLFIVRNRQNNARTTVHYHSQLKILHT